MLKKIDVLKENILKNIDCFICPICNSKLKLKNYSMVCTNNHCFDLSKKGGISLLKKSRLRKDNVYNKELFINRKNFILNGYYNDVYNVIVDTINKQKSNNIILDMGSGDGTHDFIIHNKLLNNISTVIGVDISKE